MSYPRPGRIFSPNARLQVPRLGALRERIANLSGGRNAGNKPEQQPHRARDNREMPAQADLPVASGSSLGAEEQPELPLSMRPTAARPAGNFFLEH